MTKPPPPVLPSLAVAEGALIHPYPSRVVLLRAALVLGVVVLVTFGIQARTLGFYVDDWVLFESLLAGDGWWARVRELAGTPYAFRSLALLIFPTLFQFAGFDPVPYQLVLVAQDAVLAFLYYTFLRRWSGHERLSLTAAALAVIYPVCPTTHHWISNGPQQAALALTLASFLAHLHWLERRKPAALAASLGLYAVTFLIYEAALFMFIMEAAALSVALLIRGEDPRQVTKRVILDVLIPYGAVGLVGMLWQKLACPALFGLGHPKGAHLSARWFWVVYSQALVALGPELWGLIYKLRTAWTTGSTDGMAILWALFTFWGARQLRGPRVPEPRRGRWPVVGVIGGAGFIAAYLPYALSGGYEPQIVGILSRVNANGALVAGLAVAALLEGLAEGGDRMGFPRVGGLVRTACAALLIGSFTWTNWFIAQQWAQAYALELQILEKTSAWVSRMPYVKTLVLKGAPELHNGTEVFKEDWGFSAALRIKVGRKDLQGVVFRTGMATQAQGLFSPPARIYPYDGLFMYDVEKDKVVRLAP